MEESSILKSCGMTDIGLIRQRNEDYFTIAKKEGVLLLLMG